MSLRLAMRPRIPDGASVGRRGRGGVGAWRAKSLPTGGLAVVDTPYLDVVLRGRIGRDAG